MPKRIYSLIPPLAIVLIWLFIAIANYTPGTYLSGWDTLHPEFNFAEYFKRVIFGVWQDHQGLGAVASQAHASELPRLVLLYISSIVVPQELLRYLYIFACLLLGPLGVYFFLRKLGQIPSFLASLFYLLNLITVQQFFVPFEMFATHYATLPWIIKAALDYLGNPSRKNLLIFAFISLLSSSIAHTATLWYAYFFSLVVFLGVCSFVDKTQKTRIGALKLVLVALLTNLFWILPNLYFILGHADEVSRSKIHSLFTSEAFAQNSAFGNIADLSLFKNFLFNWGVYAGNGKFEPLLKAWSDHLENPFVVGLGYLLFSIVIFGIYKSLSLKSKVAPAFLVLFLLGVFFWINVNFPTGAIFKFFQEYLPLFKEGLRFPFTKFSIILLFASTFFFAWGVKNIKLPKNAVLALFTIALIYFSLPAFSGNLISPYMRNEIPKEYFELFKWFKTAPDGRIAYLPVNSFWGWNYYDFEKKPYQGAGFLWFGLEKPILEREFDRWQGYNEQYYREISQAVYSKDSSLLSSVLSKYNISYILLDQNLVSTSGDSKPLFISEAKTMFGEMGIKEEKSFGKLAVYKTGSKHNIYILNKAKSITPQGIFYEDFAFKKNGHYIVEDTNMASYLPFRNIIDNKNKYLKEKIRIAQEGIYLTFADYKGQTLAVPNFEDLEENFAVELIVEKRIDNIRILFEPKFPKAEKPLLAEVKIPSNEKNFLLSINRRNNFLLNNPPENTPLSLGTVFLKTNKTNSISLYIDKSAVFLSPDFENINFNIKSCDNSVSDFGINASKNGFTLVGKGKVCAQIPLSSLITNPSDQILLGLLFNNNKTPTAPCISDDKGSCLDYELTNINRLPLASDKLTSYFEVEKKDIESLNLEFFHNPEEGNSTSYQNVQLSINKPFYHTEFSRETISLSLDSLKSPQEKSFLIPFTGLKEFGLDISSQKKGSSECENMPGLVSESKKQILKHEFKDYIRYEGSFCDHFSYKNLSQNQGYLVIIESRNIKGLPLRLCVSNSSTKRCDIYAHLAASKEFQNEIFLLPPTKEDSFDINIHNFEIKNIPAVNDIASVSIVPFPYSFLSRIESNPTNDISTFKGIDSKNINKSLYQTEISEKGDILVLMQSFENGWKAYKTGNTVVPFFAGELKEHVLVNGWANGWETDPTYKGVVIIVFMPQYLQYIGFLILIFSFAYLLRPRHQI